MKRLTILLLLFVSCFCAFAAPAYVSKVNQNSLFALYETDLYYDGSKNEYGLYIYSKLDFGVNPYYYFVLSENDFSTFRKTVEKAIEWKNVARSNEVTIDKEIPNSSLSLEWYYYSSGDWIKNETDVKLDFSFSASRASGTWLGDMELYSLDMKVINGERTQVISYIDGRIGEQWDYVEGAALTELSNATSKKTVDTGIKKLKVQDNADSLFN